MSKAIWYICRIQLLSSVSLPHCNYNLRTTYGPSYRSGKYMTHLHTKFHTPYVSSVTTIRQRADRRFRGYHIVILGAIKIRLYQRMHVFPRSYHTSVEALKLCGGSGIPKLAVRASFMLLLQTAGYQKIQHWCAGQ